MECLRIKNFLIIEEADFEVGRFNIIIGSQASGKSIIAKLLHLCRHFAEDSIYSLQQRVENGFERVFPKHLWKEQSFEIQYQFQERKINLSNNEGVLAIDAVGHKSVEELTKLQAIIPTSLLNRPLMESVKPNQFILNKTFIPASRSSLSLITENIFTLIRDGIKIDYFFELMAAYYEQSRKLYITNFDNQNIEVKNLFTSILKGRYEFKAGQDWITTERNAVPLAYTSSGQQEALPMLVILSYIIISTDKNYITIEEPEAHLFPVSQKNIIELLALLYSQNNHDFVLTTHSPYILTAINNAILAHDVITEKGKEAVKDIFNLDFSIQYEDVRAYTIKNGKLMSILDDETRLIGASVIDSVSDEFENVFNSLLEL